MIADETGPARTCALLASAAAIALLHTPATAQSMAEPPPPESGAAIPEDENIIIVTAPRGSIVRDIAPLATLDERAIEATGATNMSELLKAVGPVTRSADGAEPIMLLNGQRISSYQEVGTLPPEAIAKMEVLPEPMALRFGYPPTRRVLNFITKRNFQQTELNAGVGSTTRLGSVSGTGNIGVTKLRGDARLSLSLERKRTGSILQSERDILPDPDLLFDGLGNVAGLTGGEIDPALSEMAGQIVTVAPVPAGDHSLSGFAAGANLPRLFDMGPYRTLSPRNDSTKAEATWGDRIGTIGAMFSLGGERSRNRSLSGLPVARLIVPATNPYSPFSGPVALYRYLTEVDPLRQTQTTTKLRAGGTLRGAIAGWRWDLTTSAEQQMVRSFGELRVDLTEANAAIAAGANPFAPLDASLIDTRLTDRARLRTRTASAKTVVTNAPFRLPAGEVNFTATAEVARSDVDSRTIGADPYELHIGRTRSEAGVAIDLPIASRRDKVLPWIGELSLNGSQTARHVSGFGSLHDRTLGASWGMMKGVQVLLQDKRSAAAPPLEQLANPVVRLIDFPLFDYLSGRTELVELITGGNPDLEAERRHVRSIALNIKPFEKRELRLSATYEDVTIRDQTGTFLAFSPAAESILSDQIVRDPSGRLVSASFRPTNFYLQRQKLLNVVLSASGQIGKPPPESAPPAQKRQRFSYYGGIGPTIRFSDRLQLRRGTPWLDLLDGDSISGWGPGRFSAYFYGAINHPVGGFNVDGWYGGKHRVRNINPAADLRTSPILKINASAHLSLLYLFKDEEWARKLQLKVDVQNLTDARPRLRDALGRIPNRSQPDYADPVGRTVTISLRKRFQGGGAEEKEGR